MKKKTLHNIVFLVFFIGIFMALDVYLSSVKPVSNSNLFYKNDYEKTIEAHNKQTEYKNIFFGNSVVISAYDEEKTTTDYINFGIDYGKITDLTGMLKKGFLKVDNNIVLGLNYFTFMDTLDTNPSYPWHRHPIEPYVFFERDRLYNLINTNLKSLLNEKKLSDVRYLGLQKSVYYGKMTPEQLDEKIKTHSKLFWHLGLENYKDNLSSLKELCTFCKDNNIRLRAVWMPWYKDVSVPDMPEKVKEEALKILKDNNVEVLDMESSLPNECFHDLSHLNWEEGAGVFTKEIDKWLVK